MLLRKEFVVMCFNLGLEDYEIDLAESIWCKCENAMFGAKENKVPSILAPVKSKLTKQVKSKTNEDHDHDQLTQPEVQKLIKYISRILNVAEKRINEVKKDKSILYDMCDPENANTIHAYDAFNSSKKELNKLKSIKSDMANIQVKLKKLRKNAKT